MLEEGQYSRQKSYIVVRGYSQDAVDSVCLSLLHEKKCKNKEALIVQSKIGSRVCSENPRFSS